jgi:hypothetical protein
VCEPAANASRTRWFIQFLLGVRKACHEPSTCQGNRTKAALRGSVTAIRFMMNGRIAEDSAHVLALPNIIPHPSHQPMPYPMPHVLELWLVRHGESTFNAEGRFAGWSDPPAHASGGGDGAGAAAALGRHPI